MSREWVSDGNQPLPRDSARPPDAGAETFAVPADAAGMPGGDRHCRCARCSVLSCDALGQGTSSPSAMCSQPQANCDLPCTSTQTNTALPPAYTVDAEGKPLHSWRTLILAFLEQEPLYRKIDLSKPWDDPANKEAFDTSLSFVYGCPSADLPTTHTDVHGGRPSRRLLSAHGAEKVLGDYRRQDLTLMVIEVDAKQAVHWMSPTDSVDLAFLTCEVRSQAAP